MVGIEPFGVEEWSYEYENDATYNIAETCAASVSLTDLAALSDDKSISSVPLSLDRKLTYGAIRGSALLRNNIAEFYLTKESTPLSPDNILVTAGAIHANFLALYSLVGPGDHVVCVYPTYQQLYSVPASLGAEVSLWKLRPENKFVPDIQDLRKLLKPNTKLIILNNPNNPTGSTTPRTVLADVVELAAANNITILSDEVYRPLFHSLPAEDPVPPPSILSFNYPKTIATGSLSKAYSLAGIRVGWIASRNSAFIQSCASARDYTTISVSQIDDQVATFATSKAVVTNLLDRNLQLAKQNLEILTDFVDNMGEICSWARPTAGTTAFIKFIVNGEPIDDESFSRDVLKATGVFFCPGRYCFGNGEDFGGFVRIGYACETQVLTEGLSRLRQYVQQLQQSLPA
ncbi:MAG: hypothetical protein M1825_005161 [Sarcosagium campestre]|nr:MAG: hypothetical protein M1825_005161 [Sarcosagium campestre]